MEPFDSLPEKQRPVYEFIRDKIRGRGYGPTVREIGANFGISSPNGVVCRLKALEKKGLISREPNMYGRSRSRGRAYRRSQPAALWADCRPGVLHEAVEQEERVDFLTLFDPADKSLFVLEVHGESMIEDQIADGDYVVVRRQRTARKGQIVVAITDEGEATLKQPWYPRKEPHPPGARQFDHEADLRPRCEGLGRGGGRGAEDRVVRPSFPVRPPGAACCIASSS